MSAVTLLAADHPLPLHEARTIRAGRRTLTVEEDGFSVQAHEYYRDAAESLGLEMKPYRYELDLRPTAEDAEQLRAYLTEGCAPGERVELWSLWVGSGGGRLHRFRGRLSELDSDALTQLEEPPQEPDPTGEFADLICQVCVTVDIDLPG